MADQNCAHAGCKCKVGQGQGVSRDNQNYCSDHCANAGGRDRTSVVADIRIVDNCGRSNAALRS